MTTIIMHSGLLALAMLMTCAPVSRCAVIDPYVEIYALCNTQKFDNSSKLANNVHAVLAELTGQAASALYGRVTRGSGNATVNGVYQCRGDVSETICSVCVSRAAERALSGCDNAVGSRVQLETCFLRYETYSFFKLESSIVTELCNTQKNDSAVFQSEVTMALQEVIATRQRNHGYASFSSSPSTDVEVYALAQCLGYLSESQCGECLSSHSTSWQDCDNAIGSQIHLVDCYYRFETYPFFYSTPGP